MKLKVHRTMAEKVKEKAVVIGQEQIAGGIYSLVLKTRAAQTAVPGQFVSVYCKDQTKLLPRPISICEIDKKEGTLRLVYRVTGKGTGTEEISTLAAGDTIEVLGPLGNGFPLQGERPMLIGGGIGVPPMLELAKALCAGGSRVSSVLGYRSNDLFLKDQFTAYGDVYIATDDGSVGTHGTVVDAIKEQQLDADIIYACGPKPMLRAVKEYAAEKGITCYVSMEEHMACGIGACLGCVCQTKDVDHHSHVHNTRICKDGPVFLAEEVEL